MSTWSLALDIGGTFTDVILVERGGGGLWTAKTASTPGDPSRGFFTGTGRILEHSGVAPDAVAAVFHGSTVATNAILERRMARTGMLVTDGFRYVLEIGRAEIPRSENLYGWVKPKRPVPPRMIVEVPERVLVDGTVERDLDEAACREAARRLAALGVEAVAVVFLHAYVNPAHERRAAAILREELGADVEIALSTDVLPVFREYERAMATALNAGVQPVVGRYLGRLRRGMTESGLAAPLYVMRSNGGVFSPEQASRQSVHMALSGPAAGARGAALVGTLAGLRDLVTIDMGGTSADVCLIRDGEPGLTSEAEIGSFPLSIPMVDIHTIGAGGGSIASITAQGALVVGPRSAGADPGPACYGAGGDEPTVTDANLLLGRVPETLLDGEMTLRPDLAEAAIRRRVAEPLGIGVVEAAQGILALVNNSMVGALKVVSVQKGLDPRDFTLCAFGGAGPMHGGDLARALGAARLLVPRYPGILCALGLLASDLRYDLVRTRLQRAHAYDVSVLAGTWAELEREADAILEGDGVPASRRRRERAADLRYAGQGVEITVPVGDGAVDASVVDRLIADFHALHLRLYTFADSAAPVEIVNLRVAATGLMDKIVLPALDAVAPDTPPPPSGERRFHDGAGFVAAPLYRREALLFGHRIDGPAIVDQLDTTTVVLPGQIARTDRHGSLVITDGESGR